MRYISDLNISFSLLVDGVDKRFSFTPMARGGSMYIARTDAEIKALEASDMYGRIYWRMEGQKTKPSPKKGGKRSRKTAEEMKEVKNVDTWQEAIEYLADWCGSNRESLMTPDDILTEAKAKGVCFPNIK